MYGSRLPKSTATATNTSTATSVAVSGMSQSELAAGQPQQGSFTGLPTTIHIPHRSTPSKLLLHTKLSLSLSMTMIRNH